MEANPWKTNCRLILETNKTNLELIFSMFYWNNCHELNWIWKLCYDFEGVGWCKLDWPFMKLKYLWISKVFILQEDNFTFFFPFIPFWNIKLSSFYYCSFPWKNGASSKIYFLYLFFSANKVQWAHWIGLINSLI